MVIAAPVAGGSPKILARERMPVRLGAGGGDMRVLEDDAIDRAVAALVECRHIADGYDAKVVAVGTSAVREADNAATLLRRAAREAKVSVEVISGVEEARLIHLGALSAVAVAGSPHLVIDIGGGSTEVIAATGTDPVLARSVKLGHIRLTDRFFPKGVIKSGAVKACRRHVKSFIAPVASEVHEVGFDTAVGCSGTIAALAAMCGLRRRSAPQRSMDNAKITRAELDEVTAGLVARKRPGERAEMPGLEAGRVDVIVAGCLLLRELFKALEITEMVVSIGALREGLLIDRFNRLAETPAGGLHHLSDLRRSSALALAKSCNEDIGHAEHTTDLALELFDATSEVHGLGEPDREMLEAAGLLHNIGRFVAHSAHHKHSYYLIRHSEHLSGFTENELEIVALVARYHRKAEPSASHPEWSALAGPDRRRVEVLAGLLRVGIALDRTYRHAVQRVHATSSATGVVVEVVRTEEADVGIELFTARRSVNLLAKALERDVEFRAVDADATQNRMPIQD